MEEKTAARLRTIMSSRQARKAHGLLRTVSGLSRYRILLILSARKKGMKVNDIAFVLGASPSRVSHQMKILKRWGIVVGIKDGREVLYRRTRLRPSVIFPC
jgi:DNA-binding transcriptional ArsR family regulator